MNTKAIFHCGAGSNLILGTDMENQIFILRTPVAIQFFHQILKNCHLGVKINSLSTQMDLYDPYVMYAQVWGRPRATKQTKNASYRGGQAAD